MAIQTVYIELMPVSPTGTVLNKSTMTIAEKATASTEARIKVDTDYATTAGNPTIKAYLAAEDGAGRKVVHMSSTMIVTQA